MSHARLLCFVVGLFGSSVVGCPGQGSSPRTTEPCRKLGEQCQFEPGKLGACSYRANCDGPDCLYCQSQH